MKCRERQRGAAIVEFAVLVSLLMKEKTYIYLNKRAVNRYAIRFMPAFYKIVRVQE